jgi:hypothetical protein
MPEPAVPPRCPSCGGQMVIVRLECPSCGTEVNGEYEPCSACRLEGPSREIFDLFLRARGNLKRVQRALGVSYPTARQRVEEMFRELGEEAPSIDPQSVLRKLRDGEIDAVTAERLLSGDD